MIEKFLDRLREDAHQGRLELPVLPDVAIQALFIADQPDTTISDIADLVSRDSAIAGRIIRHANSPAYRGTTPCTTLRAAITRLGLQRARQIIIALAMRETFETGIDSIAERAETLWKHSLDVAILSYLIARTQRHLDAEVALLAGLVHDIGALPILKRAAVDPALSQDPEALEVVIRIAHVALSRLVLKHWNFHPETIRIVVEHEKIDRTIDDEAPVSELDVLQAANIEALRATRAPLAAVDRTKIAAIRRLAEPRGGTEIPWDRNRQAFDTINSLFAI
ncbi:MAG: HDOD domain-containing protein [Thioalkalivibrionaceae bacterium]